MSLGIGLIELRIGLIELGTGLIELGTGLIELRIGLKELGIGLMELGIGLRINNALLGPCIRPCSFYCPLSVWQNELNGNSQFFVKP